MQISMIRETGAMQRDWLTEGRHPVCMKNDGSHLYTPLPTRSSPNLPPHPLTHTHTLLSLSRTSAELCHWLLHEDADQ